MDDLKFEQDLEFVQLLCNPDYLRWLIQEGYFEEENFKKYLKYLEYWSMPKYSIFLTYPQCLVVLSYLNGNNADRFLKDENTLQNLGEQQYYIWLNKRKRYYDVE